MTIEELADLLASQVNTMSRAQYLLLASSLKAIGGKLVITADEFAEASAAPLPHLDLSIIGEYLTLQLKEPPAETLEKIWLPD